MGHFFNSFSFCALAVGLVGIGSQVPAVRANEKAAVERPSRIKQVEADVSGIPTLRATMSPVEVNGGGGVAGDCPPEVVTHTDANFGGGAFVIQAGFAEGEMAAAEYVVPVADFPLRVDLMEMIFATSGSTVTTTTHWTVEVWEGNPETGNMVFTFSSDGSILPHIVIPPGTNGVNVQASVDPGDPDQIIVQDNPSHSFTIGFRIDEHNNQTQNPCFVSPPTNSNAFPTTDNSGLSQPSRNWIFAVDCGQFGCASGWSPFNQFTSPFGSCSPSGDWVMRATYTPVFCADVQGACCLNDGSCLGPVTQQACTQTLQGNFNGQGSVCVPGACPQLGACCLNNGSCVEELETGCTGSFQGEETLCAETECPQPPQACCFEGPPSSCTNLFTNDCFGFGGTPAGNGTTCATTVCFPRGACCHPAGTCTNDVAQDDCVSSGGTFQGNQTLCSGVSCPQPSGACCSNTTTFCSAITQASCGNIPNTTWAGAFTNCMGDADGDGEPDACDAGVPSCVTDLDCDDNDACTCDDCNAETCSHIEVEFGNTNCAGPTAANLDDILCVLTGFANFALCPAGDIAPTTGPDACQGNDIINLDDILAVLGAFSGSDPCNCVPQ